MKIGRAIPPAAAPISWTELIHGFQGIVNRETEANLEEELKEYFRTGHAFLTSSGKAALFLILSALKTLSGKTKVIIPAYTCFSVPSAIRLAELEIVLCDLQPGTFDFDYSSLERLIDDDVLCIVPTHLFGIPADLQKVRELCGNRKIFIVEDAAQAMGAEFKGKKLGTFGDAGIFSLGRGKNITSGSGGIIVTSDPGIAASIRALHSDLERTPAAEYLKIILETVFLAIFLRPSLFWLPRQLPFLKLGETRFYPTFPARRFTGFQAGLLHGWRSKLERLNQGRATQGIDYIKDFGLNGKLPVYARGIPYNRFPVHVNGRQEKDALCEGGKWKGISPMYPSPVHRIQEIERSFDRSGFEVAERVSNTLVTLPTHILMNPQDKAEIRSLARRHCVPGDHDRR